MCLYANLFFDLDGGIALVGRVFRVTGVCWLVYKTGTYFGDELASVHLSKETAEKAVDGLMRNLEGRDANWKKWHYRGVMIEQGRLHK